MQMHLSIGPSVTVIVEGDVKELIRQAAFWSEIPKHCPVCQSDLILTHRSPQGNEYYGLKCLGAVPHEVNFGEFKDKARGLYYKPNEHWKVAYGHRGDDDQQAAHSGPPVSSAPNDQPVQRQSTVAQPGPQHGNAVVDPVSKSLGDMITSKQLGMIRAISRETNLNADMECLSMFKCSVDALSKRAASDLIEHLQNMKRSPSNPQPLPPPRSQPDPPTNDDIAF